LEEVYELCLLVHIKIENRSLREKQISINLFGKDGSEDPYETHPRSSRM
jgi:hypothetical protein